MNLLHALTFGDVDKSVSISQDWWTGVGFIFTAGF
jgi:hypothetical protein